MALNSSHQNISWITPHHQSSDCQQLHSSEYVSVLVCITLIFMLLLGLYVIFFKWVYEVAS